MVWILLLVYKGIYNISFSFNISALFYYTLSASFKTN